MKILKEVRLLAKILDEEKLSVIEVKEGDSTIRLERSGVVSVPIAEAIPSEKTPTVEASTAKASEPVAVGGLAEFKAPVIGIYYAAPSPDAKPFISVGQKIKKGTVVCIIEAMKVLNEIHADRDGEVVDILVSNGQVVEYGQVIYKLRG